MPVTVPQTLPNLLSYFQTGDTPTQDQFEELIRTMFFLYQETLDAAAAAEASAAAVEAAAAQYGPRILLTATIPNTSSNVWTNRYSRGVASIAHVSASGVGADAKRVLQVNFSAALSDAYYIALPSGFFASEPTNIDFSVLKTTGYCQIVIPQAVTQFNLGIWDARP